MAKTARWVLAVLALVSLTFLFGCGGSGCGQHHKAATDLPSIVMSR